MPDGVDKDSAVSLFEPMSPDALERQKRDFPLNEPLTDLHRKEAVEWLLSPNGGGVTITLANPYNNPEFRDALIESLLLHSWFGPSKDLENRIPLKGTTAHNVSSSTIPLALTEEPQRKIDVAIKPSRGRGSRIKDELKRLEKFRGRGIPTVEPFGLIDIKDAQGHASFLMTVLKKGIVPMQKINFEQLQTQHKDVRFTQLTDVMQELATLVADMHNRGITHGDLYLRNIAIDLTQGAKEDLLVFDAERSSIMGEEKLGVKNRINQNPPVNFVTGFRDFEKRAEDDTANLAADIAVKNPSIPRSTIFKFLIEPYLRRRLPSHGRLSDEAFLEAFDEKFNARYEKLQKSRTNEQLLLEAISAAEQTE